MDDSENALRAVSYVSTHFRPDAAVTLFSVIADTAGLCDMNSPELTPFFKSQQSSFCQLEDQKRGLVKAACERARAMLVEADGHQITFRFYALSGELVDEYMLIND